jgi:hypothetical protein
MIYTIKYYYKKITYHTYNNEYYESLNMPQQMWVYDVPSFDSAYNFLFLSKKKKETNL